MKSLKYTLITLLISLPVLTINAATKSGAECKWYNTGIFGDCLDGGGGLPKEATSTYFGGDREETINNKPSHKKILDIDKKRKVSKEDNSTKPIIKKSEAEKIREELKKERIEAKKGNFIP